ncbi:MAG: lipocalin family protein [Pseudomonadota bacterium]
MTLTSARKGEMFSAARHKMAWLVRRGFAIFALLATVSCASQPSYRSAEVPLETVEAVDLDRYLGKWYEIARFPNRFEKDCEGVTAEYARRQDGLITVTNTCRKNTPDGPEEVAKGRARIVNAETNAELKVSFFGPFWGDYWIIHLEEDYSVAIVSEPKGRYLWILSRTPTLPESQLKFLTEKIKADGFDTDALYFTRHN